MAIIIMMMIIIIINIKLLLTHYMKLYEGVKLLLFTFLTFTLDTDGW
jgi:hypothetical protein